MSAPPKVFISATSGDLRSVRQIVKEALLTINCHPVEQTNFEPDWRTVSDMLRGKIADCQALIHIVGLRYGAEPDPATLPPGTPRRSYTQMEYDLGCQLHAERGDDGFRVYTFLCPEDFPYDTGAAPEPEDKQHLQRAHRTALMDSPRLYERVHDNTELQARILALREQVLSLLKDQKEVKHEVHRTRSLILLLLLLLLLLMGGFYVASRLLHRDLTTVIESQHLDTAKVKEHLRQSSEHRLEQDLQAADLEKKSDDRQRLRDAAQAAHQSRLARIDELAASFALIEGRADATAEVKEMSRILAEEGVDPALRYIEGQRTELLRRVAAADAAHTERRRAQLQPLLQAAGLQETKGQTSTARASYQELLKLDPQWPEALLALARAYGDERQRAGDWYPGHTMTDTLAEANTAISHAESLPMNSEGQPSAGRLVLANALTWAGAILMERGQAGDKAKAYDAFTRSLTLAESYAAANPDSAQAARDVSVSLNKLGDFLAQRGQPGDADTALQHYQRSLDLREKLLAANPDSAQAARDVWVSCAKLGLHAERTGQGDAQAWWRRAYEILKGMKQKGMFLSPSDLEYLETLRAKVGEAK